MNFTVHRGCVRLLVGAALLSALLFGVLAHQPDAAHDSAHDEGGDCAACVVGHAASAPPVAPTLAAPRAALLTAPLAPPPLAPASPRARYTLAPKTSPPRA